MVQAWEQAEAARRQAPVEPTQLHDANPWLRMTRWTKYLQDISPADLLRSVEAPDPDTADPMEQGVLILYHTVDQLARKSQRTVTYCGQAIRMEAVRTQAAELPHQPLLAYMDATSVRKHVQPWQQILGFFARTQHPQAWQSPAYQFTARQQQKWARLWQLVQHPEPQPELQDVDEALQPWLLERREQACLEFCVELLNQRHRTHEYESALVCAMAVLGRGVDGWRDADSYPPILSRVIKIARFFVVEKALWLDPAAMQIVAMWQQKQTAVPWALQSADDELEDLDKGYASGSTASSPAPSSMELEGFRSCPEFSHDRNRAVDYRPERPSREPSSERSSDGFSTPVHPVRSSPIIPRSETSPVRPSRAQSQDYSPWAGRTFQDQLERMVRRFLVRGSHGPMQTLLDWRTYGLRVHYNSTTPGHITWQGTDELLYKELRFTMGDFRGFIHGLVETTRELLDQLLLCAADQPPPAIPWGRLYDNPVEGKAGWSFVCDSRTTWPVDGQRWLIDRVRAEPTLQAQFIRTHRCHPPKIRAYFRQVVEFKEKLAVLTHICGGQPSRAPELLSIQHVNTDTNVRRNIYIDDGMVALVTAYHKGFYASNDAKIIHRYVPREIGELIIYYLWLVRPFVDQLDTWLEQQSPAPREPPSTQERALLWGPDPGTRRTWSSDRFREVFKRETQSRLTKKKPVHPAADRDIAIGISRRFLRASSQFPQSADERHPREPAITDPDNEAAMDDEQWPGHIADLQAAHSSHVAGMVYGRGLMEQAGTTAHRQAMFRASSTDWHRFLGFASAQLEPPSVLGKRKRAPWEDAVAEQQIWRRHRLQQANLTQAARRMTQQAELELRGVQGPALHAIQHGESPIVAVMPTGGGKSMLFMLPAYVEPSGTTVVVIPLIALRQDFQRRCQQLNISYAVWERRRPPDEASIVLVTPESAITPEFHSFLNRLRIVRRLDRIVIDECHVMLPGSADFRPAMRRLGELIQARTQLVFLTATLPPTLEQALFERIGHAREAVRLFRAPTTRSNIRYLVWRPEVPVRRGPPDAWIDSEIVQAGIRWLIQTINRGKTVIYANVVSQVVALAEQIGCEAYTSQAVDRTGILARFVDGRRPIIAATSALGMGVDIPDIRLIIHVGTPRTLLDYAQESGRAGRDGQTSVAVIIQPAGWDEPAPWMADTPVPEIERMQQYMAAPCRRQVLDQYLDGQQRAGCVADEAPCDQCRPIQIEDAIARMREREMAVEGHGADQASGRPISQPAGPQAGHHAGQEAGQEAGYQAGPVETPPSRSRSESFASQASSLHRPWPSRPATPLSPREPPQWAQADIQARQRGLQAALTEEAIIAECPRWLDHCYICTQPGRDGARHDLYGCRAPDSQAARQWMLQVRRQIQYARYSACFQCGMPQTVCPGWEDRTQCAYRGILIPMVAAMVYGPQARPIQPLWQDRLAEAGVDTEELDAVTRFLGQIGRSGHSQLFDIYCWLREIYREIEGQSHR